MPFAILFFSLAGAFAIACLLLLSSALQFLWLLYHKNWVLADYNHAYPHGSWLTWLGLTLMGVVMLACGLVTLIVALSQHELYALAACVFWFFASRWLLWPRLRHRPQKA